MSNKTKQQGIHHKLLVLGLTGSLILAGVMLSQASVFASDDDHGRFRRPDATPIQDAVYQEECGACHMAYQPGWLPKRSWQALMTGLEDHFGDNAELDAQTHRSILTLLENHASEHETARRARNMGASIATGAAPLRITETRYFRRKHHEVPSLVVSGNPEVRSFSHCDRCHQDADQGWYDEDQVDIPGVPRRAWDD